MVPGAGEEYNGHMPSYGATTVRVYLVDDHHIVRQGLRDLLAPAHDIEVVGDSALAGTAAEAILSLAVDVMVLDLQLQDGSGIEVCRRVRSVDPSVRGLLLTSAGDDDALVASVLAGAVGYVVKVAGTSDIAGAIRRVGAGRTLLDAAARGRARELVASRAGALSPPLTDLEADLLERVIGGATDRELTDRLERPGEVATVVDDLTRRLMSVPRPVPGRP